MRDFVRKVFDFEWAMVTSAWERSKRSAHSSVASVIRAIIAAVATTAFVTGSIVASSWMPIVGGVAVLLSVVLWHLANAPRRQWESDKARIAQLEGTAAGRLNALEKAQHLEEKFKEGEALLSKKVVRTDAFEPWRLTVEEWSNSVSNYLESIKDNERFMFDTIGFGSRAESYRAEMEVDKHKHRLHDLEWRLTKLRAITDRLYTLASLPAPQSLPETKRDPNSQLP